MKMPVPDFMNISASQPASPPTMMAAIHPTCGSFISGLPRVKQSGQHTRESPGGM
ncbi:hypothetical protein ACQPTN_30720 [Bradyrhizobium sp. 13971]